MVRLDWLVIGQVGMNPSPTIVKGNVHFLIFKFIVEFHISFVFVIAVCGIHNGCHTAINLGICPVSNFMFLPEEVVVVVLGLNFVFTREDFDLTFIVVVVAFLPLDELLLLDASELQVLDVDCIASASTFLHQFPGFRILPLIWVVLPLLAIPEPRTPGVLVSHAHGIECLFNGLASIVKFNNQVKHYSCTDSSAMRIHYRCWSGVVLVSICPIAGRYLSANEVFLSVASTLFHEFPGFCHSSLPLVPPVNQFPVWVVEVDDLANV